MMDSIILNLKIENTTFPIVDYNRFAFQMAALCRLYKQADPAAAGTCTITHLEAATMHRRTAMAEEHPMLSIQHAQEQC